jgi:oligoendopeptidase F
MFDTLPKSALDALEWGPTDYQPYIDDLLGRTLNADNVDAFLRDWTRLSDLLSEVGSRLGVATTQNTADEDAKGRYVKFVETIFPPSQMAEQQLKEKLLASGLSPAGFEIPLRNMRLEVEIFRAENLPLMVEEQKLGVAFDEVMGAMTIQWEGQEIAMKEIEPVGNNPDRVLREAAWRASHGRFLQDRAKINELWGKFLGLRLQMAKNAGYKDYVTFRWKQMGRVDYTPDDCATFHAAIEEVAVPAAARIYEKRRQHLGVATLRPWDMNVDPTHPATILLDAQNRKPLRPFETVEEMDRKAVDIFGHVDPALGSYYTTMQKESLLDLAARKNKANTAYCTAYPLMQRPFVFMNATQIHDSVQTLLHEAGHAFHVFESVHLPYAQQRGTPIEMAEVASMSMELLAAPYLSETHGGYYSPADAARARIDHLEGMITFWPYMAVVDSFQLWVYRNPEVSADPAACDEQWGLLWDRFMRGIDWTDLDVFKLTGWHRKLHIHQIPFYYIEYGLAQLGAAQVWAGSLKDQAAAVASYRKALALGGSRPLPELYEAAGAKFSFDANTLHSMVDLIEETIGTLEKI